MTTTFLDPRVDIVFRKLFGNDEKPELTIDFLNHALGLPEEGLIQTATFAEPHNILDADWLKASMVDVKCTTKASERFTVELQIAPETDYRERCQYYMAQAIARQLHKSVRYQDLEPVVFVAILDFKLFNDERHLRKHSLMDEKTHESTLKHSQFFFIELPKFTKSIEDVSSPLDKWLYFIKHASELEAAPKKLQSLPALSDAFSLVEQSALSRKELAAYHSRINHTRHAKGVLDTAKQEGKQEGLIEGKLTVAKQLLTFMPVEQVAEVTGFSPSELKKLKLPAAENLSQHTP